jgi:hypothetical protein
MIVGKWTVKTGNGAHHSFAFTFFDTPFTIRATDLTS